MTSRRRVPALAKLTIFMFGLGFAALGYLNYLQGEHAKTQAHDYEAEITELKARIAEQEKASAQSAVSGGEAAATTTVSLGQLGVELKVSDPLTHLTYQYQPGNGNPTALLTTQEIVAKYASCQPGAIGSLVRVAASSKSPSSRAKLVKTIGDFTYYYTPPSGNCGADTTARAEVSAGQTALQNNTLATLQAAP